MTEGTSTSGAPAATETAGPVAAAVTVATPGAPAPAPVDAQLAALAALAANAAPLQAPVAPAAVPAVGPAAAALAAVEAVAAVEAAAAAKAAVAKAKKADANSDDASMSDAEVLPEVELAQLGEAGAATAAQAEPPCGVLPVVDAVPVVDTPVVVPVGDAGFALSPVLLGLLGLGALGAGLLLLRDKDGDPPADVPNEPPVAANDAASVNEDATVTGSVATNDSDPDGPEADLTYSLNSPVAGLTLNADGSYTFDASNAAYPELAAGATQTVTANYTVEDPDGGTDTATLTITITGVNTAPVITSANTAAVDENVAAGTEVYDANATDADGDTLTYSIGGADAASFTIDAATGEVFIIASPDFETQATYNITVTATDPSGASDTEAVVITINDLVENMPPVLTAPPTATVDENMAGAVVLDASATDPDGDTVTFSLTGADAALFTIDATTGVVTINAAADFETNPTYNITVVASDGNGGTDSQDVVVSVNDIVEPVVQSLDIDDDANPLTPFTFDAGAEMYLFQDDDDVANNIVLINFGAEDVIQFESTAVAYSSQDTGDGDGMDDLLITVNNGGIVSEIRIEDVVDVSVQAIVFDEATAEAAVAGTNNFQEGVAFAAAPNDSFVYA